jgi:hypothetical protein
MKERWGRRWRAHRTDGRSRRRAARLLHDTILRYDALLTPVDHFPIPLGDITATAITFMADYGMRRGPRGNRHLRRGRNDRNARHRLRAPALDPAHDVHRPFAARILPRQATALRLAYQLSQSTRDSRVWLHSERSLSILEHGQDLALDCLLLDLTSAHPNSTPQILKRTGVPFK